MSSNQPSTSTPDSAHSAESAAFATATAEASSRNGEAVAVAAATATAAQPPVVEIERAAPADSPPLTELTQQLEKAQEQIAALKDQLLRGQADQENIRRRAQKEVENAHKFALDKFATELLAVVDSLELGRQAMQGASGDSVAKLIEGTEMTLKLFLSVLEKFGVKAVGAAGEPFNPQLHQAISMQPSTDYPNNTLSAVMQKGYLLNERLIRPAMVMVSNGPGPTAAT